jgi:hypothetical protein
MNQKANNSNPDLMAWTCLPADLDLHLLPLDNGRMPWSKGITEHDECLQLSMGCQNCVDPVNIKGKILD